MDASRCKADDGAASNDKSEHRWRSHSGFIEEVAPDFGERRVCADCGVKDSDEQIMIGIEGEVVIGKAP